jgi:rod shape-determining protein MreC
MIHLSIQTRQALSRLTLPMLIGLSCGLIVLAQADPPLAARARAALSDRLAPVYALLDRPVEVMRGLRGQVLGLADLAGENRRLRAENHELRRWYEVATALAAENQALKANLRWLPDPAPQFVTARAVADAGGIYGRAVLLAAGAAQGLRKGEIAVDADGLVGRITEIGARSARVLLITDVTSRVPVTLDGSHAAAILVGSNASAPRLMYYPDEIHPAEGERVVTSSEANAYPAGLPVGIVHYLSPREPVIVPAAHLDHVDMLRIFDYGLSAITPPEAPGHVMPGRGPRPASPAPAIGRG